MAVITAVTPNPAMDVTYRIAHLDVTGTNRVTELLEAPGGKGVNVARVASRLGTTIEAVLPLGGAAGAALRSGLEGEGVAVRAVPIVQSTRRTVTVVPGDDPVFSLNEPGPTLSDREWDGLVEAATSAASGSRMVTVSGSVPRGVGAEQFGRLLRELDRPVLVDTSGELLITAARCGAFLLAPNRAELEGVTGSGDPRAGADQLLGLGAHAILVTLGPDGMLLVTDDGVWRTVGLEPVSGNPTGAGDAALAALAVGLADGLELVDALPRAAAAGAAAVLDPIAGRLDPAEVDRIAATIHCERMS